MNKNNKEKEMTTFTDRINLALKESGMSQHQLASQVKVSQPAIQKLLSGKSNTSRKIVEIAKALDVDLTWLTTGDGEMRSKLSHNASILGTIDDWDNQTPLDSDEVEVPFYKEIHLAAGNGFSENIEDYNGYKLRLSRSTMKRYGIDKSCVVCLTVNGDSMEPVLQDGSTVGINKADTKIKDGKIYAINHDGLLRIKILERLPGNQVKIKSYHSDYEDEIAPLEKINVLGRVWWSSCIFD